MTRKIIYQSVIWLMILMQGCGFYGRRRGPNNWYRIPHPVYAMPPYALWVRGLKICLDPGHGGDAHLKGYKRGPHGVREAEMNLRVAYYLKAWLEEAGAEVTLTRYGDDFIDLADRAAIANRNNVDMFISLHHNATSGPETNYASTWYHGDADLSPVSLDLARYVQQNLTEYLRLPQHLPAGLLSDQLMYPEGFGVLRRLKVPGILIETSFFSNFDEEKLLDNPRYNELEAWSHFIAICQWAAAGIPRSRLISPKPDTTIYAKQPLIQMEVRDGLHERKGSWMLEREQVFSRSIHLFLDDKLTDHEFVKDNNLILCRPPDPLSNGWHSLTLEMQNYYGNHNIPRPARFRVAPPAAQIIARASHPVAPADGRSIVAITAAGLDDDRLPIADGDSVSITTDYGQIPDQVLPTFDGSCTFYLQSENRPDTAHVVLRSGNAAAHIPIVFRNRGITLWEGRCLSARDSLPLADVVALLTPSDTPGRSNRNGWFFFPAIPAGGYEITFRKDGYWPGHLAGSLRDGQARIENVYLNEMMGAVLHNFVLVLDPRFGGAEKGSLISGKSYAADINVKLAKILSEFFIRAGAQVFLLHDGQFTLSPEERVTASNQLPDGGYYVRLEVNKPEDNRPSFVGAYYPGSEGGKRILENTCTNLIPAIGSGQARISASTEHEIRATNRSAISIGLNLQNQARANELVNDPAILQNIAYAIYNAFALELGKGQLPQSSLQIEITRNGTPLSGAEIILRGSLKLFTDKDGKCRFELLEAGNYSFSVSHPNIGSKGYSVEVQDATLAKIDLTD